MTRARRKTKEASGFDLMTPAKRSLSMLLLAEAEEKISKADRWHGQCFGIASLLVKHKIVAGVAVYGHWLGPIAPTGHWKERTGMPFVHHGWVKAHDGRVIDPTRFSFEDVAPYIYIGESDHYDEGGNNIRLAFERPCPVYVPPENAKQGFHQTRSLEGLERTAREFVEALCGFPPGITTEMLFWVANLAPSRLEGHQDAIYAFLCGPAHLQAALPKDNYDAWKRKSK